MKNLILLATFLTLAIALHAGPTHSAVVVKSNHGPVWVSLDRRPSPGPDAVHRFNNLPPGRHFIEIYRASGPAHPFGGPGGHRLVYSGYIDAFAGLRTVYVWSGAGLRLSASRPLPPGQSGCAVHGGHSCSCSPQGNHGWNGPWVPPYGQGGMGYGYPHQPDCPYSCCVSGQSFPGQPPYGYPWPGNYQPGGYGQGGNPWGQYPYGGRIPMTDQQFNGFMQRFRSPYMESQKLDVLKREIDEEWLTNAQVNQVLSELYFESNKLEAARFLYHRSAEPDIYHGVADAFAFSSSRDDLNDYMARHPWK